MGKVAVRPNGIEAFRRQTTLSYMGTLVLAAHNFVERSRRKGLVMSQRATAMLSAIAFLLSITIAPPQASAQTTVYYQPTPYPNNAVGGFHILDGWFSSQYQQQFQKDDKLQIGGWFDNYNTYIQFDTEGLPANVTSAQLQLYAYDRGDTSTLVNFDAWSPNSTWASTDLSNATIDWDHQPSSFALVGSYNSSSKNSFWSMNITSRYNTWQANPTVNNRGIALMSWTQNNNFDVWRSSRYTDDTKRPRLRLVFTPPVTVPNFKMPLPRNVRWLVTTEVGGWDCEGSDHDSAHDDLNYFSVDFSWRNKNLSGSQVYGSPASGALIPITPAANGQVVEKGYNSSNGNYVVVSHDPSHDIQVGFSTRYLHMKDPAPVTVGQTVTQGLTVLGYMGSTGVSTGPHLHFGIRYNDDGSATTNVKYAVVSGWLMKSFQTECASGTMDRYYMSN